MNIFNRDFDYSVCMDDAFKKKIKTSTSKFTLHSLTTLCSISQVLLATQSS